jgi:GntR family transcriptional repressor for pyruvate dehydrogenase complex
MTNEAFRPEIRRETLVEQVAQILIDYIEANQLTPGFSLPAEQRLADEFKVSRPVIREAFRMLEVQGIIQKANGKSAIIKPTSSHLLQQFFQHSVRRRSETIVELLELRRGVEIQSAILAAERRTDEQLVALQEIVGQMNAQLREPNAYTDLDAQFHLLIAEASQNRMIFYLVEAIREPIRTSIQVGLSQRTTQAQLERVQAIHEELVSALAQKDAGAAAIVMAQHFDEAVMAIVNNSATTSRFSE